MRAQDLQNSAKRRSLAAVLYLFVILALALASCTPTTSATEEPEMPVTASTSTPELEPTMAATEEPAASDAAPQAVNLRFDESDEFGSYLVDENGMALYLFTNDTPGVSNCEDDCLAAWPPLLIAEDGEINVEGADDESMFTTITRSDGSTQVAFNDWPLYYWVNDTQPGQTTGQGVGDVWYLMDPAGNGIGMDGAAESSDAEMAGDVMLRFEESGEFGPYLVDDEGMALYLFTKDTPEVSNCFDQCLANWPPLLVEEGGEIVVEGADDDSMFTTFTRSDDGSTQVAFNGWPLYYWVNDTEPGQTSGQGVGDVWYLMDPAGNGIGMPGASSSSMDEEDYPSKSSDDSMSDDELKLMVEEDAALGEYLVDEEGMTLYLFTNDTPGVSNCEGQCLVNWPPLLVEEGTKVEIDGMDEEGVLGTITRSDGTMQVTYKDMPLYYWVNDTEPGQTTGHGVGDVWFVVEP